MSRKRRSLTELLNDLTFANLYDKYKMLALYKFEWSGLPEGIKPIYIERLLFSYGRAIFFRDPKMDYMCLEAHNTGQLNVYGEPLSWHATGFGYNKWVKDEDCVIIDNNDIRKATHDFIMFYVNKLTEAERTMDVNVKSVKTPYIIACDDKDVLTFKRIFHQIDGNTPAIYADKGLNLDALNVLKTEGKFLGNDLMDYKKSVENELLTFLGFNNLAVDKKERVNVSEANSNNEVVGAFADLQLKARQRACEEMKTKLGYDGVTVRARTLEEVENYVDNEHETDLGTP